MKRALKTVFAMVVIVLSCLFAANAVSDESKYEYHDSSWYLSVREAEAFMGFIYDLAPEDLAEKEFADLAIKLLSGQYADSPEDEYIIKMAVCEVALTQMNSRVARYDHASVITSTNLINWLKGQVGENPTEEYANNACNAYLDKIKEGIIKAILLGNTANLEELEITLKIQSCYDGVKTIVDLPKKAESYAKAVKAGIEAVLYAGSSSRSAMYKYFLACAKTRDLANSTVDGFELAMNYNVFALVNQGLYDPFLNWADEDNQKVLNRWAELFYWLTEDVGGIEFVNDNTSGTTSSTLEPVEFVPGTGTAEGKCGDKVKWHLDASTGILNIYGEGKMDNYASASKAPWYGYRQYINYIKVSDGVTSIGNYAFAWCSTLDKVYLSADLNNIGDYAFYNCVGLRIFVVDGNVNNIGAYAFSNCKNLVYFDVPESIELLNDNLFCGCTGLVRVELPERSVNICNYVFSGCTNLTSINLNNVNTIGICAFSSCSSLTELDLSEELDYIDNSAFSYCTNLTSIGKIPSTVTYLGDSAFSSCSKLTTVGGIPSGVTYIGGGCFSGCKNLSDAIIIPKGVTEILDYTFNECQNIPSVKLHNEITEIGKRAFMNCSSIKELTIPESIKGLPENVFSNCVGIKELTIPASLEIYPTEGSTYNGHYPTFSGCNNIEKVMITKGTGVMNLGSSDSYYPWYNSRGTLKEVIVEDGVTNIIDYAFAHCSVLEKADIPDSITTIDCYAFYGCKNLAEINLKNVATIANSAFSSCSTLTEIELPDGLTKIDSSTFSYCSNLTSIGKIPATVTYLGDSAFSGCSKLTTVGGIPSGVTYIGGGCFSGCSNLADEIIIPLNITVIYSSTFYGCQSIPAIKLHKGITEIGAQAFYECRSLTELTIPESVESLAEKAFMNCTGIKELTLPASLKIDEVGSSFYNHYPAFYGCNSIEKIRITKGIGTMNLGDYPSSVYWNELSYHPWNNSRGTLKEVIVEEGVTNIIDNAFYYCSVLEKIELPDSVTTIGNYAFSGCSKLTELTILNKTCSIYDSSSTIHTNTIIKAPCGSTAYDYAKKYNRSFVSTEHTLTDWLADFTVNGDFMTTTVYRECIYCGEAFDSTTHTTMGWVIDTEATCTTDGSKHLECLDCGNRYDTVIPATGHSEVVDKAIYATCTETGLTEGKHCSVCRTVFVEQTVVDALGHDMSDWYESVASTCTENGEERTDCSRCDYFETRKTQPNGHSYTSSVITPTCTKGGYTTYTCSVCGDNYTSDEVASLGHTGGVANCKDKAICETCGEEYGDINADNHKSVITDEAVEATCTATGLTEGSHCDACGTIIKQQTETPKLYHSYESKVTEATCTEDGYTTFTCTICGHSYISELTDKMGHNFGDWYEVTSATCEKEGLEQRDCSECDYSETQEIPATGHDFDGSECKNCDYDKADTCGCNCHKGGIAGFFFKLILFFQKIFKTNQICEGCGIKHY